MDKIEHNYCVNNRDYLTKDFVKLFTQGNLKQIFYIKLKIHIVKYENYDDYYKNEEFIYRKYHSCMSFIKNHSIIITFTTLSVIVLMKLNKYIFKN